MKANRVKKYMGLGVLLLVMTGCGAAGGVEPEPDEGSGEEIKIHSRQEESQPAQREQEDRQEESSAQMMKGGDDLEVAFCSEEDDFYAQCLQNLRQGNNMTYADGYYYFRSQTMNYSLCRTRGTGMPVEEVADQVPGAIYVREDQVYFINVSDNRTLYCVGTDGNGLRKLSDFPMQELVVLGDRIYFRSVYDREYDPFYQLTEEAAEGDRYLYSMNLDGSGCELLFPELCLEFVTDGQWLYCQIPEEENLVLYKCSPDGKEKEEILCGEDRLRYILPYQGNLYWADMERELLVRLNAQGEEEILASDVWYFTISDGQAYVINEREIRQIELETGEEKLLADREKLPKTDGQNREDIWPWYAGTYNRGIFLVNGQVFAKYYESEEKGVLWHILEGETFVVFEDMEPLTGEELVLDTSLLYEANFYYPGREDEGTGQYLDADRELYREEFFGTREDGSAYGKFSVRLPVFSSKLASYEQMNRQMEELLELALEDKDSFFQEMSEWDQEQCISWWREHEYSRLYVGETYISMFYCRGGYEGGMREWRESVPLIFDRETGLLVHMDDLFTVEKSVYGKRLTGAVYKYCEMTGMDWWNEAFDNNLLVKNLGDLRCYLTPDGIVLCYERYEIQAGASGSPTFEIPYEWFADIFRR